MLNSCIAISNIHTIQISALCVKRKLLKNESEDLTVTLKHNSKLKKVRKNKHITMPSEKKILDSI